MANMTAAHTKEKSTANVRKPRPVVPPSHHRVAQVDSAGALARAMTAPASELSASDMLALQQTVGNSAVLQLLTSRIEASATFSKSAPQVIQAKLAVGPANDHFEQEADRIAQETVSHNSAGNHEAVQQQPNIEKGMARQTIPLTASITPLQAKIDPPRGLVDESGFEKRLQASRGSGSPLPEPVRSFMEARLGADFSNVRVHSDSRAMDLNREINAKAFTQGTDIYFRPGAYDPRSTQGQQLLAHELTHVVQQGAAGRVEAPAQRKTLSASGAQVIQRNPFRNPFRPSEDDWGTSSRPQVGITDDPLAWASDKVEANYDAMQERQKPGLVAAGVGGAGSVASGAAGLTSLAVSSADTLPGGGAGAGLLNVFAGPINVASGLYNASRGGNTRQKGEGYLSAAAGLGQTFTGAALGVDSVSKLASASTAATRFLSSAVLPAQIAMGGVDVVRGFYGGLKAHRRQKKLERQSRKLHSDDRRFAELAAKYQGKRQRTAFLNQLSGAAAVAGGSMLATGVGAVAAVPLLIASGVLKIGSLFGGAIREKYINAKRKLWGWLGGEKKPSYSEEKRAKENEWVTYGADEIVNDSNQNILRTLGHMGMHQDTIDRIKREPDRIKREDMLRSLLMRR